MAVSTQNQLVVCRARPQDLVDHWVGEQAWLSNFFERPVEWDGIVYPSAEAAFHAGKTLDVAERRRIAEAPTPAEAKRRGRVVALRCSSLEWDNHLRYDVMDEVLAAKFRDPDLAGRLIGTGTALLVERTRWCDNLWGWCECPRHRSTPGANMLGRALMRLRSQLNPQIAGRWTRVACTGHRPDGIPENLRDMVVDELGRLAHKLVDEHGMEVAISGLGVGSDLWWAQAQAPSTRVWGYSPSPDQDNRWGADWKDVRREVIDSADRVEHLGPDYRKSLLFGRNRWLVRDCDALVAVLDRSRTGGGTVFTVGEAEGRVPVITINVDPNHDPDRPRVTLRLPKQLPSVSASQA